MAAYVMIRIDCPDKSDTQVTELLKADAHAGVQELIKFLEGIQGGVVNAQVNVATRSTTEAISSAGNGSTASYNLK